MKASIFSLLWMSVINAQTDINFSYEMKYGDGKQVTGTASDNPDTLDYNYFENLLDINTFYGDNIYFYTQLEYSNHPVYGNRRSGLDSLVNTFYLEYSDDRINIKLGNQYELFGRGMSFYTLQNQNIDYDNSVKGLSFKYFMRENIEISALIGKGDYFYRSNPSHRETDLQLNSSVLLGSVNYTHDWLGYFQYMNTKQQLIIDPDFIRLFDGGTEIHDDIAERLPTDSELQEGIQNIENLKEKNKNVKANGSSQFNPGWHEALAMRNLLITAEAVARAAHMREESRGAHTRDDFTTESEERYQYNIISKKGEDGNMQVIKEKRKEPNAELFRIANAKLEDLEAEVAAERKA